MNRCTTSSLATRRSLRLLPGSTGLASARESVRTIPPDGLLVGNTGTLSTGIQQ